MAEKELTRVTRTIESNYKSKRERWRHERRRREIEKEMEFSYPSKALIGTQPHSLSPSWWLKKKEYFISRRTLKQV